MASIRRLQPAGINVRRINGRAVYSHVVTADGGRMVFIAGQVPKDPSGAVVGAGDMGAQLRQVCENVRLALAGAGAKPSDLVETTTYVTDMAAFFRHAAIRVEFFGADLPTSTTVQISRLAEPEFMVEMKAIAVAAPTPRATSGRRPRRRSRARTRRS